MTINKGIQINMGRKINHQSLLIRSSDKDSDINGTSPLNVMKPPNFCYFQNNMIYLFFQCNVHK